MYDETFLFLFNFFLFLVIFRLFKKLNLKNALISTAIKSIQPHIYCLLFAISYVNTKKNTSWLNKIEYEKTKLMFFDDFSFSSKISFLFTSHTQICIRILYTYLVVTYIFCSLLFFFNNLAFLFLFEQISYYFNLIQFSVSIFVSPSLSHLLFFTSYDIVFLSVFFSILVNKFVFISNAEMLFIYATVNL